MTTKNRKSMKLASVFFLGCVLFNYPILSLFNINIFIMGLPVFYVGLFAAWAGVIFLIFIITKTGKKKKRLDEG